MAALIKEVEVLGGQQGYVLADGGELIIYAPHIREVCVAHGKVIEAVGYHCRDYFLYKYQQPVSHARRRSRCQKSRRARFKS